jgi:hypothetical protein
MALPCWALKPELAVKCIGNSCPEVCAAGIGDSDNDGFWEAKMLRKTWFRMNVCAKIP